MIRRFSQMRHKIRIEKLTGAVNSFGEETSTWELHAVAWASIEPAASTERFTADQRNLAITHQIKMRFQSGITGKMRVRFRDRSFNIESIENPGQLNEQLNLLAREDQS